MGATLDRPLAISARRACLPSSVLARAQAVDSACGVLGPGRRSKHWTWPLEAHVWLTYGSRAHGLAACCAWVQLRHCMFNWTLALTRTEMHGVGSCRSSKDDFKQHRLFFFLCSFITRLQQHIPGFVRQKKNNKHENSNSGLRDLVIFPAQPPSVNHAGSCPLGDRRQAGGFGARLGGRFQFR